MLAKKKTDNRTSLFFPFGDTLDQPYPLFILSQKINWAMFDQELSKLNHAKNGFSYLTL